MSASKRIPGAGQNSVDVATACSQVVSDSSLAGREASRNLSRNDRVEEIRRSMALGSYRVGSEQLAAKLEETMLNEPNDRESKLNQERS